MVSKQCMVVAMLAMMLCGSVATANDAPMPFPSVSIVFEQNATDEDVEAVFDVTGGTDGLVRLVVVAPDGRTVVDFTAPDAEKYGLRHFRFESPEPRDVAGLKAAFPEGTYRFSGSSAAGEHFQSQAVLSHALPQTASFQHPKEDAEGVPVQDLKVRWSPVAGVAHYVFEIEQEELGMNMTVKLPAETTSFLVPAAFLAADVEYTIAIGTIMESGNASFVETSFSTAE